MQDEPKLSTLYFWRMEGNLSQYRKEYAQLTKQLKAIRCAYEKAFLHDKISAMQQKFPLLQNIVAKDFNFGLDFVLSFTNGVSVSGSFYDTVLYFKFQKETFIIPREVVLQNEYFHMTDEKMKNILYQVLPVVSEIYYKLPEFSPEYIKGLCRVILEAALDD